MLYLMLQRAVRVVPAGVLRTGMFCLVTLGVTVSSVGAAPVMDVPCVGCHEDAVAAFSNSFHARIWAGSGQGSCEACHGPTDEHMNGPSRESVVSFSRDGGRSAGELSRQCLGCHAGASHLALWDMGQHSRQDVACSACHDIHENRATVNEPTVCFGCHKDKKLAAGKRSHHPLAEGKVKCSDCHNPHGSMTHGMISEDSVNQVCYKCHAEKRGPFIWEHPPVEENCATCHNPHGSRHAKLLTAKIPNLCQNCHDWQRHPGTPYDNNSAFTGSSPSNRFLARSCMNCHNMIHGSTAPANPDPSLGGYNSGKVFVR